MEVPLVVVEMFLVGLIDVLKFIRIYQPPGSTLCAKDLRRIIGAQTRA
jgi:hypothetical protein